MSGAHEIISVPFATNTASEPTWTKGSSVTKLEDQTGSLGAKSMAEVVAKVKTWGVAIP